MNITYVLPGVGISGGIAVVLQHANRLKKRGYKVSIINLGKKEQINWFKCDVSVVHWNILKDEKCPISDIDIVVATHFSTAKIINDKIDAKRKIYFVQSDERRFGLNIEKFIECHNSYLLDLEFMTEAVWIQRWLKEEFNKDAYYVPNGLDKKIFYKTDPLHKKNKKPRILLEGPINIPFKGMKDAYAAVKNLDCELWIISSFGKPLKDWKYDKFFESVSMFEMHKLYSSCDIFLKMSRVEGFFGPPLEAMACGCSVVVSKCTGYDEYIKHGENALVVDMYDIKGAEKLIKDIIKDKHLKNKLIENGYKTAKEWSWDRSIDLLEKVIKKESVEVFYTENFPERYDFKETLNKVMFDVLNKESAWLNETKEEYRLMQKEIKKRGHVISSLNNDIFNLNNEFYSLKESNNNINVKLNRIQSSKFWKLRNCYMCLKNKIFFILFNPKQFIKKYIIK